MELGAVHVQMAIPVIHAVVCRGAAVLVSILQRESWSAWNAQIITSAQMDEIDRYRMGMLLFKGKFSFFLTGRACM